MVLLGDNTIVLFFQLLFRGEAILGFVKDIALEV